MNYMKSSMTPTRRIEICVVDIDCIVSIKKDDQLKEKSIQQMSKEPKYSTGEFSANKLIKKPT